MTAPDPEPLSPAEDARIRGLLTEARHTDPMPDEVRARMDSVIAGLAAEREPVAAVVPITAARERPTPWRRRIATGLVAAAAVVAVGVGVPQLLSETDYSVAGAAGEGEADEGAADAPGAADAQAPELSGQANKDVRKDSNGGFRAHSDVEFVLATSGATADEDARALVDPRRDHPRSELPCWRTRWGAGDRVPVLYDDRPGVAVLRLPSSSGTRVDLYVCDQVNKVRSVLVRD